MATWDDVWRIVQKLPDTEASTSYGKPCFKVGGKTFVSLSPHEPGAIVLRVPSERQRAIVEARPDLFFITPHYEGYGTVLIRLDSARAKDLGGPIRDSYEHVRGKPRARRARSSK